MFIKDVDIPKNLTNSPIKQAYLSIKYKCKYPDSAIYGLLIDEFQKFPQITQMPALQLPEEVRKTLPEFKYQELYRCFLPKNDKQRFIFGIGSSVINFAVLDKYTGWQEWHSFFMPIFKEILRQHLIISVESISCKYVNLFDKDIFPYVNTELKVTDVTVKDLPLSIKFDVPVEDFNVTVNISNSLTVNGVPRVPLSMSMIDIETTKKITSDFNLENDFDSLSCKEHDIDKKVFFSLISKDLLTNFGIQEK